MLSADYADSRRFSTDGSRTVRKQKDQHNLGHETTRKTRKDLFTTEITEDHGERQRRKPFIAFRFSILTGEPLMGDPGDLCCGIQRINILSSEAQPRALVPRLDRFVGPTDFFATSIRERRASFTDSSVGNAFATSGLSKTTFVPDLYSSRRLPRTPAPKSPRRYSGRSSSDLAFFIYPPFLPCHATGTDNPHTLPTVGMCDYQQSIKS